MVGPFSIFFNDTCSVYNYEETEREDGSTAFEEILAHENVPCFLDVSSSPIVNQDEDRATVNQIVTLYLDRSVAVKRGSRLAVKHNGVTRMYKCSGVNASYKLLGIISHQKCDLMLDENV